MKNYNFRLKDALLCLLAILIVLAGQPGCANRKELDKGQKYTHSDTVKTQCEILTNMEYGTTQIAYCWRVESTSFKVKDSLVSLNKEWRVDISYLVPVQAEFKDSTGKVINDKSGKPIITVQYLPAPRWVIIEDRNKNFDNYLKSKK